MRLLILGGTSLTLRLINEIVASGFEVAGVVSIASEFSVSYNKNSKNSKHVFFDDFCESKGIPHYEYTGCNAQLRDFALDKKADFCLVAGWYFMLSEQFCSLFPKGCVGIHASLLPKLRGVSPLNWAMINGFEETGVSVFNITKGMDEGDLHAQKSFSIDSRDTIANLVFKCEETSVEIILDVLKNVDSGQHKVKKQVGKPSYCAPRIPSDSLVNWNMPTKDIDLLIRASTRPYPGAYTFLEGRKIIIWSAAINANVEIYGVPGQIINTPLNKNPVILCNDGYLEILDAEFSNGEDALGALKKSNFKRTSSE